ncbi:Oidioi.mRNA.OKI2018_I69.chr2.g5332.t2.cds [Oikopleura dioica]|nr:Oidioi.mRNA.OKI2018_I69.chr2.g5332.t2.cds [Oikopleura dioica]
MMTTNDNLELNMLWGYGCHCFTFNDRPLSTMGSGQPRDQLDRHCKEYKECQRCARDRFGDECVPEIIKLMVSENQKPEKAFSSSLSEKMKVYNNEFSIWSRRWDRELECVKTGTGQGERKCCGLETGPYFIYHERRHQCCDGTVSAPGTC